MTETVAARSFLPRFKVLTGKPYAAIKRGLDLALVLVTAPITLPLMLLVALAIKLEDPRGSVLFFQQRTGIGGRRFTMFKFRTMVADAEKLKTELARQNKLAWPDFKVVNDPRITRVGKILRKTSLDEIPQLINVLLGDMSLVGPRPTSFKPDTYKLWQSARLEVRPGLTGLWQIAGRGHLEFEERVRLDILYIRNRSLMLDIMIMLFTIPAALKGA
ncbi:MAG: sugar transferase [Gammaproteobacteria bacterium]|nr:sugar transferase [Gammaproteobacteria bacterium]